MPHRPFTGHPQVVQALSPKIVNKLCINFMLLGCNDLLRVAARVRFSIFLPTMKFQPSQLPMIVGSGRAVTRRALFSFPLPF